MDYSLFQPGIFDLLKDGLKDQVGQVVLADDDQAPLDGPEWFCRAMNRAFNKIADQRHCEVLMSKARLKEAHHLWLAEIGKIRTENGGEPDHFKRAGFLAYWLRRRVVISVPHERDRDGGERQKEFLRYSNEFCSFIVGYWLCLFFEAERRTGTARKEELQKIVLDRGYLFDSAVLLHHKNVSPHAMYLIYKSLFYNLGPLGPDPDGKVVRLSVNH